MASRVSGSEGEEGEWEGEKGEGEWEEGGWEWVSGSRRMSGSGRGECKWEALSE